MPRSRPVRAAAVPVMAATALTLAGVLSGCGTATSSGSTASSAKTAADVVGSGTLAGKSAAQVYAAALAAARSASAVHLKATLHEGQSIGVDLTVVTGRGATGSLVLDGAPVKVVALGTTVYALPSRTFVKSQGAMAALFGSRIGSKWIKADAGVAALAGLGDLSHYTSAAGSIGTLMPGSATMSLVSGRSVGGQSTVGLKYRSAQGSGTLYVAASGTPYPLLLQATSLGTVAFSDWGRIVTIAAPPAKDVVDLNKLGLTGLG